MTAPRIQHLVSSSIVLVIAAIVSWISFTQQPVEAFLFPRLISVFFIGLAAWNFVRAATGLARVGEGLSFQVFKNMVPGIIVMLVYVFYAAKGLGFYLSSTLVFLTVYTLYDPSRLNDLRAWMKRIVVTVVFMSVVYGLFAMLLKVQTPRGIWF